MQQIILKRSTISAMNQAFQSYCKAIDQQERSGVDVEGVTKDFNGYLLMVFVRQIITQSGEQMSAGEYVIKQLKMMNELQKLDVD